ncbi:hypothetical protein J7M22_07275 [Candidatus Poribacteria bacterium]|nr:hypothetical protein [Candidatus Poribacteria bacterium]
MAELEVKEIQDKAALGSESVHLRVRKLPRYQITALDTFSRLRMMGYCYSLNRALESRW